MNVNVKCDFLPDFPFSKCAFTTGQLACHYPEALNGKLEGPSDAALALGVIGGCLALPPTLFTVAAALKDLA